MDKYVLFILEEDILIYAVGGFRKRMTKDFIRLSATRDRLRLAALRPKLKVWKDFDK